MRFESFDAVVIGAGPAGASSALLLARLGWRTAIVDRAPAGRAKACGHCLAARAGPILHELGLMDDVAALSHGRTTGVRVHVPWRCAPGELDVSAEGGGWIVDRASFDALLVARAAQAGVRVIRPASASVMRLDPAGADVKVGERTLRCRLLVGADGLSSGVARAAGLDARRPGRKFGFSFDVEPRDTDAPRRGSIEMFLGEGGYLGAVRQRCGVVHLGGLVSSQSAEREPVAFVESLAGRHPLLRRIIGDAIDREAVRVCACGPMPRTAIAPARGAVALVGDAAGYVEPFTGEGMAWALESAACLGAACARGVWDAGMYTRLWRERVGRRMRLCRVVAAIAGRPALAALAVGLARPAPWPARLVAARVVGA